MTPSPIKAPEGESAASDPWSDPIVQVGAEFLGRHYGKHCSEVGEALCVSLLSSVAAARSRKPQNPASQPPENSHG